jgi:predicted transcriptional regulator
MLRNAVSQLPVLHKNQIIGTITEENIIRNLKSNLANEQVANEMDPPLPVVAEETALEPSARAA